MKAVWSREEVLLLLNSQNKNLFEEMDKESSFWSESYVKISPWLFERGSELREWVDSLYDWNKNEVVDLRELFEEWDWYENKPTEQERNRIKHLLEEEGFTHMKCDW